MTKMMGMPVNRPVFDDWISAFERLVLLVCAILFFSACTDGYPTEEEFALDPVEMNQAQRLKAMNRLGQQAHPEFTWLYRLMPDCRLQWTVEGGDAGKETFDLPAWGADVSVIFDRADQIYGVQARPTVASDAKENTTLLLSKKWVDALALSQLVRLFQAGCNVSSESEPRGDSGQS